MGAGSLISEIRLLCPIVTLVYNNGGEREVTSKKALVLARLAVASGAKVQQQHLVQLAWPDGDGKSEKLNDVLKKLRRDFHVPIPVAGRKTFVYSMKVHGIRVDATELITGVSQLTGSPGVALIDPLLALCRGEPQSFPGHQWWEPVGTARRGLIQAVRCLPEKDREHLKHLPGFLTHHPEFEPPVPAVDGRLISNGKKRLLIVEDNPRLGRSFVVTLRREYDCTLLASFDEWAELTRNGLPHFDGALVDRHLTESMNDSLGLHVLEYLRDLGTPAVLMTVDPPFGFPEEAMEQYGLVGVYRKSDGHVKIHTLVDRLFEPGHVTS